LRDEGLIKTLGAGKVAATTKIRGAKRTLTLKAKTLLVSRKIKRIGPISQFMQSLADHNQRILNRSYIQENNINYLPTTKPTTCQNTPPRDILSILENKLKEKPNDLALQALSQAKRVYKKIQINNPLAYANALIRQVEGEYKRLLEVHRKESERRIEAAKAIKAAQDSYVKPSTDAISPSLMQIRNILGRCHA
jgi:hypothetical protein